MFHVRDLARIYGEGTAAVTALAGVDLDLYAGELIVLLGASGSGKSTLLNQLGGLDSPTHGTLLYRGTNLAGFDENELTNFRRDAVGFVFQAYNLIPSLTAREKPTLSPGADFSKMKVGELRALLASRGVSCTLCAEKSDFVREVAALAAAEAAQAPPSPAGEL